VSLAPDSISNRFTRKQKGVGGWGQPELKQANTALVTTGTLDLAKTPGLPYEQADGTPPKVDTDYFGKQRSKTKPTAGPFEHPGEGDLRLKVW